MVKKRASRVRDGIQRWLSRRSPKARVVVLRHRSIYVLPTRYGLSFMALLVAMWLLGTNYENNLILAISFLLLSVLIVSTLYTYRNLAGLEFQPLATGSGFVGNHAQFPLRVSAAQSKPRIYENIHISVKEELPVVLDLVSEREQQISLTVLAHRRGWLEPGRLLIETSFPFGLMRAWSWIELETGAIIYPAPIASDLPPLAQANENYGELISRDNVEDFDGLMPYRPGANLSQVAWKQYARGAGLHLKEYVGYQSQDIWLDWHLLPGLDTEARLSRLCFWVLQLGKTTDLYGLRLPNQKLELGSGKQHQERLLKALALYDDRLGAARSIEHG